jgi:hypothetical protein
MEVEVANLSEWSCNVKNKDLTPSDPLIAGIPGNKGEEER